MSEYWIYVSKIGSVLFMVLCLAAISDAIWKIRLQDNLLSAIKLGVLSIAFGGISLWLW